MTFLFTRSIRHSFAFFLSFFFLGVIPAIGKSICLKTKDELFNIANISNTTFVIQDNYDLDGKEISLGEDCTLFFSGGSISNGIIRLNNTFVRCENGGALLCNTKGKISNDLIDVKIFGAKGDGKTDDIEAIERAKNVMKEENNWFKTLYFPSGIYAISKGITIDERVVVAGNDYQNTTIKAIKPMEYMITQNNSWFIQSIHDIAFDGGAYGKIWDKGPGGLFHPTNAHNFAFAKNAIWFPNGWIYTRCYNVRIQDVQGDCIYVGKACYGINFRNLYLTNSINGIHLTGLNQNVKISDCNISGIMHFGVECESNGGVYIEGNIIETLGYSAIFVNEHGKEVIISRNYIEYCCELGLPQLVVPSNREKILKSTQYAQITIVGGHYVPNEDLITTNGYSFSRNIKIENNYFINFTTHLKENDSQDRSAILVYQVEGLEINNNHSHYSNYDLLHLIDLQYSNTWHNNSKYLRVESNYYSNNMYPQNDNSSGVWKSISFVGANKNGEKGISNWSVK